MNLKLKCICGEVEGVINSNGKNENSLVCYCKDCQAFASYLGDYDQVLDENGGSYLYQVTPNKFSIHKGLDKLMCMQLSPKGMKRWYTSCCRTPVANTISAKFSFYGVYQNFIDSSDNILRPTIYCMGKYAKGKLNQKFYETYPLGITFKILKMILLGRVLGWYRPNVFFNLENENTIKKPLVLTKEERDSLCN